jgi:hypothetical protein
MKDHVIADTVNKVRDVALEFHAHDSLRERIAGILVPILKPVTPVNDTLVEALLTALPFVEDLEHDQCYKKGVVKKHIAAIRAALANAGVK